MRKQKLLTIFAIFGTGIAYLTALYGLYSGEIKFLLFSIFWTLINNIEIKIS